MSARTHSGCSVRILTVAAAAPGASTVANDVLVAPIVPGSEARVGEVGCAGVGVAHTTAA